tara:strand:+ start:25 stop:471 length:447 start_codon:yes stop_codon:yes gene_type:complete
MRTDEFVIRGQTESQGTEKLTFSGHKDGYAYRLTEFSLYPSTNINGQNAELAGTITAGKTSIGATSPNFNDDALIATAFLSHTPSHEEITSKISIVNDTFLITQDLILTVRDSQSNPINWQCRFKPVKMSKAEDAVNNYKQFLISSSS